MTVQGGVRSGGIGNHPPRVGLVRSAGAVAAGGAVGLPALATALTVAGMAVGSGASDQGLLQRRIDAAVAAVMAVHRAAELAGASEPSIYL